MCLAIPGKIVKIEKDKAIVKYGKERRGAKILEKCEIGDYVIVQNGFTMLKVPEKEALKSLKVWSESK